MKEYGHQKWFNLYKTALLELEHVAMIGRIGDARAEIAARLETLKQHPRLHQSEYRAIQDALSNLRMLERAVARLAEEKRKRLLPESPRKLHAVTAKFREPDLQKDSN
jgi:hypothetical protein